MTRITTDALFRQAEALRFRIEELEAANESLVRALNASNERIARLARRVKALEVEGHGGSGAGPTSDEPGE